MASGRYRLSRKAEAQLTWSRLIAILPHDVAGERRGPARLFESYRRGDYAQAAACFAPDVVYEVGQELPARGPAEVRAMWERWDGTWDELETVPEEFTDAGDQVLVSLYYSARGRGSGIAYEERLFDVYTFSDGQCVRKREFRERSAAVESARLAQ